MRASEERDPRYNVRAAGDPNPACERPGHRRKSLEHGPRPRFRFAALLRRARSQPGRRVQTIDWWWKTESGLQTIEFALGNDGAQGTSPQTTPPWRDVSWMRKPSRNRSSLVSVSRVRRDGRNSLLFLPEATKFQWSGRRRPDLWHNYGV